VKIIWTGAACVVVLLIIVVVIGYSLPQAHRAVVERTVKASPEAVFMLLTKFEDLPAWRSGLRSVEILRSSPDGRLRYREIGTDGAITYSVDSIEANRRLVTRIDDPRLPFGGTWTFELGAGSVGGTSIRITEDGEIYNPVFRFVSKFVLGYDRTIRQYLADMERALAPIESLRD
jgi:uncharacterized protein YndB with AHSA1/START domain